MPTIQRIESIQSLTEEIPGRDRSIEISGLSGSERAYCIARMAENLSAPIVVMVPTASDAETMLEDLLFFGVDRHCSVLLFPPYNILPYQQIAYHNETAAKRVSSLYRLMTERPPYVAIATAESFMQKVIPKKILSETAEPVIAGEEIDRQQFIETVIEGGYFQAAVVEEPGDFSVRGGIIDIFSPMYDEPLRLEFFGDTVDTLRFFDPATQRTTGELSEAVILPARETVIRKAHLDQIATRIRTEASIQEVRVSKIREIVGQIREEGVFPGVESLLPLLYSKPGTIFDYLDEQAVLVTMEPAELERSAHSFWRQITQKHAAAMAEERFCCKPESLYLEWREVVNRVSAKRPIALKALSVLKENSIAGDETLSVQFRVEHNQELKNRLKEQGRNENLFHPLAEWITENIEIGCVVVAICRSRIQAERLQGLLEPYGISFSMIGSFSEHTAERGKAICCIGQFSGGFVWGAENMAVITADEIFGGSAPKRRAAAKPKPGLADLTLSELKEGDLVVHDEQGIGQYNGLVKLTVEGVTNDFLLIGYYGEDRLYLPVDRLGVIQKYMGIDGKTPVLDKMGGRNWEKVKERVKRSAQKIADELLKLYASRKVERGFAFSLANRHFREFEAGFPYEETDDQAAAIRDVLEDMEKNTPMDRLVCGDVGYGKTEVALRAAFKAIGDGKQVAMVVPTTVLAEQHFKTFSERFERYPVTIECLTRFRSAARQKEIVRNLASGGVDIAIGTHRLFQKDVKFKDLGLLVLDEEQRFGVKHKEKLKRLRKTVDVLTLTATPIPRTLHMSLTGIRDISVISTPPEQRRSIITYISKLDDSVMTDAIQRELDRNGQIFFIHNNIHGLEKMAGRLKRLVPEVRLDIAHGRMKEDDLESVMRRFANQDIDMLVCTTIVESGLDIPSANTILINHADRFGLAQMYQLRGRVGRSEQQAYAYLFIPPESHMTRDAQKRLKVLMEHSDLGSGFQIAMNDLRIRGGGTILGASQSGHIAAVGYDMFLQLMENAVAEARGEEIHRPLEPEINVPISAFIPESYIPDIGQRLSGYRRLARMDEIREIKEFKTELADRFGRPPDEVKNLLLKIMLKVRARKAGVQRLDLIGRNLSLQFSEAHLQNADTVVGFVQRHKKKAQLRPGNLLKYRLDRETVKAGLVQAKSVLSELIQHTDR